MGTLDRARETTEKPLHPARDVHRPSLRLFEDAGYSPRSSRVCADKL